MKLRRRPYTENGDGEMQPAATFSLGMPEGAGTHTFGDPWHGQHGGGSGTPVKRSTVTTHHVRSY